MNEIRHGIAQQVLYVSRTLARGKPLHASTGETVLQSDRARADRLNGLGLLEKNGETIARAVYDDGLLVYITSGDFEQHAALERLRSERLTLRTLALEPLLQAVLLAACAGRALELGNNRSVDPAALVAQSKSEAFTGVLLLEVGLRCLIWRATNGVVEQSDQLETPQRCRVTRIAWNGVAPRTLRDTATSGQGASSAPAAVIWQVFEELIRLYLGLEATRAVSVARQELQGLAGSQLTTQLKQRLQRIGPSTVAEFERRINMG